jgi:hypothetical protein
MAEQTNEIKNEPDIINEEVIKTNFHDEIQEMYDELPESMKTEFKQRLIKHRHENDFTSQPSYEIMLKLYQAYQRKKVRSKISSKNKREKIREENLILQKPAKKRGRPKKVKTEEEPEPDIIPDPEDSDPEPEPGDLPDFQDDINDIMNEEEEQEEEQEEDDTLKDLLSDLYIPEPKKQTRRQPVPRKKEVAPIKVINNSLSGLFL